MSDIPVKYDVFIIVLMMEVCVSDSVKCIIVMLVLFIVRVFDTVCIERSKCIMR